MFNFAIYVPSVISRPAACMPPAYDVRAALTYFRVDCQLSEEMISWFPGSVAIGWFNAESLCTKTDDVNLAITERSLDVLAETWHKATDDNCLRLATLSNYADCHHLEKQWKCTTLLTPTCRNHAAGTSVVCCWSDWLSPWLIPEWQNAADCRWSTICCAARLGFHKDPYWACCCTFYTQSSTASWRCLHRCPPCVAVATTSYSSSDHSSDLCHLTPSRRWSRPSFHVAWTTATPCSTASPTDGLMSRLQSVQNAAARLVSGARRYDHITSVK